MSQTEMVIGVFMVIYFAAALTIVPLLLVFSSWFGIVESE